MKRYRAIAILLSVTAGLPGLASSNLALAATPDRAALAAAIKADHDAAVQRMRDWIALPTIAAEGRNVDKGAPYLVGMLKDAGFQRAEVVPTSGVPGVFATLDAGAKQCLGVYFMYDVKQYVPAEWTSSPLEGRLVDRPGVGKTIVARGAVNQKGPETTFLNAVRAFRATGSKLPVNLVLVAEGEEEIASPHFHEIVTRPDVRAAIGKCIGVVIPGAEQSATGEVDLELGAKGAVEIQLIAGGGRWQRGPVKDIHSSLAASVDSPAWHLVKALDTLVKDDGHTPAVPGWFDHVQPLTARQKELIAMNVARNSEAEVKKEYGIKTWIADEDYRTAMERLASQPTINIEGLVAGYTGPGGKTVLPGQAEAKIDMRLVPDMTPEDVMAKLRKHLADKGFGDIEVHQSGGYGPNQTAEDSALVKAELATFKQARVPVTLTPRSAGSWPGVVFTGEPLKMAATSLGIGRGAGAHAPDEWYLIDSTNPKIAGMDDAALFFADFLYGAAEAK